MRTIKITEAINPYDDGSGSEFEITVTRYERDDKDSETSVAITAGGDTIGLSTQNWDAIVKAVSRAIQQSYQ